MNSQVGSLEFCPFSPLKCPGGSPGSCVLLSYSLVFLSLKCSHLGNLGHKGFFFFFLQNPEIQDGACPGGVGPVFG